MTNLKYTTTKEEAMPYIKVGHTIKYDLADLLAFLESRKVRIPD